MESGWAAVVVAVLAAVFAAWQAWEARKARTEARAARDDAGDYERSALQAAQSAAGAAERSAAAHERLVAVAEESAQERKIWGVRFHGGERWQVYNRTRRVVDARLELFEGERFVTIPEGSATYQALEPGAGLDLLWPYRFSMPASARVRVRWQQDGKPPGSEVLTLSRRAGAAAF